MLQQPVLDSLVRAEKIIHAADSVVAAATLGETWMTWRVAFAIMFVLAASALVFLVVVEYRAVKAAGGLKAYVEDINTVSYGAIRGVWASEAAAGAVGVCIVLHALVPSLVSEVQIEAVAILFSFVGLFRGINFFAFRSKMTNADPAIIATNAMVKDPSVQPVVTTNKQTGTTTVTSIPSPAAEAAKVVASNAEAANIVATATLASAAAVEQQRDVARTVASAVPTVRDD